MIAGFFIACRDSPHADGVHGFCSKALASASSITQRPFDLTAPNELMN